MDTDVILKQIYYDPKHPASYGSAISLYRAAKPVLPKLTIRYVKTWLNKQDVYSLHGKLRRRFKRRKTITKGLYYQMQMEY